MKNPWMSMWLSAAKAAELSRVGRQSCSVSRRHAKARRKGRRKTPAADQGHAAASSVRDQRAVRTDASATSSPSLYRSAATSLLSSSPKSSL